MILSDQKVFLQDFRCIVMSMQRMVLISVFQSPSYFNKYFIVYGIQIIKQINIFFHCNPFLIGTNSVFFLFPFQSVFYFAFINCITSKTLSCYVVLFIHTCSNKLQMLNVYLYFFQLLLFMCFLLIEILQRAITSSLIT